MKIQNIDNVEKFFKVVDSCKGKVELVTGESEIKAFPVCVSGKYFFRRHD